MQLGIWDGSLNGRVASVIIGGLISSAAVSRIVTPVMYLLIARGGAKDDAKEPPVLPVDA